MNKNSLIGIILIIGIFVGWFIWMTPSKEEIEKQRHIQDSIYRENRVRFIEDSIRFVEAQRQAELSVNQSNKVDETDETVRDKYGVFATATKGEEQLWTIENDVLKMTLTSKGAYVKTVELKKYVTWDSLPLIGFDDETSRFNLSFFAANRNINTMDLFFTPYLNGERYEGEKNIVVSDKPLVFSLKAFTDDAVDIDPIVNISGYTNFKNAKSFSSDMRIDSVNGSRKEIGNINYLVSVMEKLDNNAIGSALNLDK